MRDKLNNYFKSETVRHYHRVMAFAVLGMLLGGALMNFWLANFSSQATLDGSAPVEVVATTSHTLARSLPVALRIPEVGIATEFEEPLGVNQDQTIEVPDSYETAGWYKYGPTPGELGPAVVLGHVDSYQGPAVFWPLRNLEIGDEIFIDREDGTTATFTVSRLETHSQTGFPTKQVYGDLDHAGLRLITCSGTYDHGTLRYSHNLIVFADLNELKK